MQPRQRLRRVASVGLALAALLAAPSGAQTLYAAEATTRTLRTIDPADGSMLSTIGALTHPNGVMMARPIAMDPITGTMYAVFVDGIGAWRFATLDLATAAYSDVASLAERIRDLTFDATGKLWAVVGSIGANANSLVSIHTASGAITLENGSLPTSGQNKIAYQPATDTLYLLGNAAGSYELYSLKPAAPGTLSNIPLSGATITGSTQPAMVYDPIMDLILTQGTDDDWVSITPAGTVTTEATLSDHVAGLAWDRKTTASFIFADGFESGDTAAWSSAVP